MLSTEDLCAPQSLIYHATQMDAVRGAVRNMDLTAIGILCTTYEYPVVQGIAACALMDATGNENKSQQFVELWGARAQASEFLALCGVGK